MMEISATMSILQNPVCNESTCHCMCSVNYISEKVEYLLGAESAVHILRVALWQLLGFRLQSWHIKLIF